MESNLLGCRRKKVKGTWCKVTEMVKNKKKNTSLNPTMWVHAKSLAPRNNINVYVGVLIGEDGWEVEN